jgi:hypothetical protein
VQPRALGAVLSSMKMLAPCALALVLASTTASAAGISITVDSSNGRTEAGARHEAREARLAITTRDGSTMLLLLDDAVAIQLTDRALRDVEPKKDAGFLEELLAASVKVAVGKSIEYPLAHIRSVAVKNGGFLEILGDDGKPIFTQVKVNGTDVFRNFSATDAARFAAAVRARRN